MAALTQQEAAGQFQALIAQQNPLIDPYVVGTDWYVFAYALGGLVAAMYQDIQTESNGLFVQFMSGFLLDCFAFSIGQPQRMGAGYALVAATTQTPYPGSAITLNAGTPFISGFNGNTYTLITQTVISASDPTILSVQSSVQGPGQQLPIDSFLTYNDVIDSYVVNIQVDSSTDGYYAETDSQLRSRLLGVMQNPVGAARAQQYVTWALQSTATTGAINDAVIIPNFIINDVSTVGVFVLSGSTDYDTILVNGYDFDRTTPGADIMLAFNYINFQKPIGVNVTVTSVSVFTFSNTLAISVILIPGLTLASPILNINGASTTVENLIIQEIRRGFITYPYGGTAIDDSGDFYILISRLEQTLDSSLSVNGGLYAQIIVDRTIVYNSNPALNIQVPSPVVGSLDGSNNLKYIYDSLSGTVTVGLL